MNPRVAVLGGGISGLASALQLVKRGARVTLYEGDSQLGGLGSPFDYQGISIERFYHCLIPTDAALLTLLGEIGLDTSVVWRTTSMGFMVRRQVYPMNGPADLLRFTPLSMLERLRLGWMGLRARAGAPDEALDSVPVRKWVTDLAGEGVYEKLWRPLLEAKLGDKAEQMPALWLASRIFREKGSKTEVKGYVPGGYRAIVDAMARRLREKGAKINVNTFVESLDWDGDGISVTTRGGTPETFDAAVATAPLIEFQRWASRLDLTERMRGRERALPQLDYQGIVNGVFLLKKPLTRDYWMPIVDSGVTCQGIVETSNLVPPERTGGLHVVYLLNYTHRSSALYKRTDAELLELYRNDLLTLYPDAKDAIEAQFVFRAPFVEPVWPLKYGASRPGTTVVPNKLYLVSTAQVYPRINAWDACCEVAREMAGEFEVHHRAAPAAAGVAHV